MIQSLSKQDAINVLTAWLALEVLAPQTFRNIEDLIGGKSDSVFQFNAKLMPWEIKVDNKNSDIPLSKKIFYQIIINTIDFKKATNALLKKYNSKYIIEEKSSAGEAIIGIIIVDEFGRPVSTTLSSFAWGLNKALQEDLKDLANWVYLDKVIHEAFEDQIYKKDNAGIYLPLTKDDLIKANHYLIETFDIPEEFVRNNTFAIKVLENVNPDSPVPQSLLLNSFYLEDLKRATDLLIHDSASDTLQKYLGIKIPEEHYDVLEDDNILESILAPHNIPLARWPGPGRYPLVLLQQAAVNLSNTELQNEGIIAVNGPPGTGKTTLLRDVLASVIVNRAEAMMKFDDPADAFISTGIRVPVGNGWLNLYGIDESLKGFEVLIASSNNKAVENISAEFPSLKAIASDANELRYFSNLASQLLGSESWGLISAILGNSANKNKFRQTFWWSDDFGLANYLAEADGIKQMIDIRDPKTKKIIETRAPKIVTENDAPMNHKEALARWKEAKKNFKNVLNRCQEEIKELDKV